MNFVITGGGQEIKYVGNNAGNVNSGTMELMAASCSASILNGNSYGYSTNGLFAAGSGFPRVGGFVPFNHGCQISFGADGSISGVDDESFAGVLRPGQPIRCSLDSRCRCPQSGAPPAHSDHDGRWPQNRAYISFDEHHHLSAVSPEKAKDCL